jgi:heat shock protein HslJ
MRGLILLVALVLAAASAAQAIPAQLLGRTWHVISMGGAYTPPELSPTVVFSQQGASGQTPCNRWEGLFGGVPPAVRFEQLRQTEMSCSNPQEMQIERQFLAGIRRMNSIRPDGGTIVLLDAGGQEIMRLTP